VCLREKAAEYFLDHGCCHVLSQQQSNTRFPHRSKLSLPEFNEALNLIHAPPSFLFHCFNCSGIHSADPFSSVVTTNYSLNRYRSNGLFLKLLQMLYFPYVIIVLPATELVSELNLCKFGCELSQESHHHRHLEGDELETNAPRHIQFVASRVLCSPRHGFGEGSLHQYRTPGTSKCLQGSRCDRGPSRYVRRAFP
jgi:hypothetical protein